MVGCLPIRIALAGSVGVAVALAVATEPVVIAILVAAAAIAFGALYTPGMALTSHRAESARLAAGARVRDHEHAWALGALIGAVARRWAGEPLGDAAPYLVGASSVRPDARRDLAGRRRES